ncbi:regulator of G-protein signaling 3 isoform X2 [Ictalurus punctatus]|uniref:Regulator of G-protein signaling 3 isoform X2 n=1 Tax=Ictalurus punctatus TaxID=7998 RepID=A0A2D0PPQ6_ICTPU|nr:regulator of G-protein signaling 3 isoform X2 [Ictalurus punctatus]
MENCRARRQSAHLDKRRSTFKEPCWLREPDLYQGPLVKMPGRERRENNGNSDNIERKASARDILHKRVLAPSQQSNVCPGRHENSEWKRALCHRSPGAQVKVAAVVKTSLTTGTTPKPVPRKRRKIHPSVFRGKGQLKLTVTPDNGLLHIQILEARGLLGRECRPCDSYVKITLVPDVDHSRRQKTRTVINCKSPVFNEFFMIDVGEDKQLKRLLVTAWNRSRTSRRSEFLGCMSFGIHSLITSAKEIRGWYYLLGEELGRNKHLRVATRRIKQSDDAALTNHAVVPDIISPEDMQSLTVTILRGKDGFGFTICSDSPVRVQAVDPGGPAHQAGLQQLDTVLQLNGQPVEHWKCVDLAHAIRNCRNEITVVVWRTMPVMKPYYEGLIHRPSYKTSGFDSLSPTTKTQNKTPPLLSRPSNHKVSRRKKGNSSESAGSGTREPTWSWTGKREENDYKTRTQTLKGTRVTSSNGDNYIILSPVNPGNQILQPVYPESNGTLGTLGRIYQTHSSGGIQQSTAFLQDTGVEARATLRRSLNSKTATIPPLSYRQSFANYQNCTLVQSHLPHSSYGTYVSLAPKILIFPVFVQPLDLCSPERMLLLSEEMILHDSTNMALKVTVFIYTDLMLLTREDEPGRCNVLQSPLYLHQIQLQDVPADKLRLYVSYRIERTECLFSLEAFSAEQKRRVYQCLRDNINKQLTSSPDQMLEPKAGDQADLGLLGFGAHSVSEPCSPSQPTCSPLSGLTRARTSIPSECMSYPSECVQPPPTLGDTSKSAHTDPAAIWKEKVKEPKRGEREPEFERREQGEGESARPTSSSSSSSPLIIPKLCLDRSFNPDALTSPSTDDDDEDLEEEEEEEEEEDSDEGYLKRRSLVEMSPGRGQQSTRLCVQRSLHRRTHSEGSLLQEPRSPRFISDQAIHCMDNSREMQQRWTVPSPQTLRKELTKNRGSVHQICLLFTGRRVCGEPNCKCQMGKSTTKKKKSKNLAKDMKNRLTFLRKKNNNRPGSHPSSKLDKVLKSDKPSPEEALKWGESFDLLLSHKYGLAVFRSFLQTEFSEENLDFWLACEDYRRIKSLSKMASRAKKIYEQYISIQSSKEVNLDSYTREQTKENMESIGADCFDLAQSRIFGLMEKDPYPRFLRSDIYLDLIHHKRVPQQSSLKAADSDC